MSRNTLLKGPKPIGAASPGPVVVDDVPLAVIVVAWATGGLGILVARRFPPDPPELRTTPHEPFTDDPSPSP